MAWGPSTSSEVLIVGSVTQDLIWTKTGKIRKIGGVTAYAGSTFRMQGIPVAVACAIAPRDRLIVDFFRRQQIRICQSPASVTTHFVNMEQNERRLQWITALAPPIHPTSCRSLIRSVQTLYWGPLHPDDLDPAWYTLKGLRGKNVALDIQGLVRRVRKGRVEQAVSRYLAPALSIATIVKSTEEEHDLILHTWGIKLERIMASFGIDEWLVTRGRLGGYLCLRSGETYPYEASPLVREGDATGAGDVFFACYLIKRILEKTSPETALRFAAQVASKQVAGIHLRLDTPFLESPRPPRRGWRTQSRILGESTLTPRHCFRARGLWHGLR